MPRYGELEDEKIIPEGGGYPSKESDLSSFLKERLKKAKDEAGDTLRGVAGMSPGEGRSGDTLGYAGGRMIGSVASRGITDAYANNKERVPNIIGNIAEKFAPSELEKKTGVATDSRLQALMNLKNKDRDFFQDVKALRKDIGETLASTLPGQGGGMSHAMSPPMSPVVANRRVTRVADNLPGQGGEMFNAMFHAMFPTMSPAMSFAMSPAMSPVVANRRVTRVADNLPGQGGGMSHAMTAASIRAGEDKKLVKSLYENPDVKMRKNYKNIMLEEFKSMPSDKQANTVSGSGYRSELDMMNDLNTNTAPTDVAKMERLRKLVGRLVPSSLVAGSDKLGKTGVSSIASPLERGYLPDRSGKGLSLYELLNLP